MEVTAPARRAAIPDVSVESVLASHFTLVRRPGEIEPFRVEGAEGWKSANPHPVLSLARWTTRDPEIATRAAEAVVGIFRDAGQGFDWMTGPEHAALDPILGAQGFLDPPLPIAAMARSISPDVLADDPDGITTRMADDPGDASVSNVMSRGFDVPDAVGRVYHDAYLMASDRQHTDVYTANVGDDGQIVGVGYLSYIGDGPMVLLRVSVTDEGHRGRGVYRALVLRRLQDAARAGRTIAVVHAYSEASQRALGSLGFGTVGRMQLHRWRP